MGKQYSDSVRSAVLDRYKDGEPVTSIAASTSIARSTIYTWINLSIEKSRKKQISSNSYRLLEKKAARLEQIIEVITKAKCSPGAPLMDFYNADRPHAHNKYRTPTQAERDYYSEHED